jgi:hypothetical protein
LDLVPGGLGHDHRIYTRLRTDRDIQKQNIFIRENLTRDEGDILLSSFQRFSDANF